MQPTKQYVNCFETVIEQRRKNVGKKSKDRGSESISNQSVKTQLTYTKPMAMSQLAEVSLTPVDGGTKVKWSVDGHNGFLFRLMGVIMNMDKSVGSEFEKGLAKLKIAAETTK